MLQIVDRYSLDNLVENLRNRQRAGAERKGSLNITDIRKSVIEQADIVCSTLSGAGSQPLVEAVMRLGCKFQFDAVIIDEAAQAIEPSALIPLKYNPRTVVMVGDPAQLPATIFSKTAKQAGLGTSLFQRLQASGYPVTMLETQYRMHPLIAEHPSRYFYHGLLKTDQSQNRKSKPYHSHPGGLFRPCMA